jgi:formyl-CoA transferase
MRQWGREKPHGMSLWSTRVTGFGQSGPYAPRAGFGSIGEAMGGIRYVTGDADRPPSRAGVSLGDALARWGN